MSTQPIEPTMAADNPSFVSTRPVLADAVPSQKDPDGVAIVSTQFNMLDSRLYEHSFAQARFKWSTSDPAGRILYRVKIRPQDANPAIRYLTALYNNWSGSLAYELYIAGTGFNGGKLIIVKIPPNLDPDDFTPDDWTFFDFFLLDPKTLDGTGFAGSDQNIFNAHWSQSFESNLGEIGAFGGTIIIGVYLPLVSTATGNSELPLALFSKLAPDFRVGQMRPPRIVEPATNYRDIKFSGSSHPCLKGPLVNLIIPPAPATSRKTDARWLKSLSAPANIKYDETVIPTIEYRTSDKKYHFGPSSFLGYITSVKKGFADFNVETDNLQDLTIQVPTSGKAYWLPLPNTNPATTIPNGTNYVFLWNRGKVNYCSYDETGSPDTIIPLNSEVVVCFNTDKGVNGPLCTAEINTMIAHGAYPADDDLLIQLYTRKTSLPLRYLRLAQKGYFSANKQAAVITYDLENIVGRVIGPIGRTQSLPPDPPSAALYELKQEMEQQREEFQEFMRVRAQPLVA